MSVGTGICQGLLRLARHGLLLSVWVVGSFAASEALADRFIHGMAPLFMHTDQEWADFGRDLEFGRTEGMRAVTVDVWVGHAFEAEPRHHAPNWAYYRRLFRLIRDKGLGIVPIMSFHSCGENANDDRHLALPVWLRQFLEGTDVHDGQLTRSSRADLRYRSEANHACQEIPSIHADEWVMPIRRNFWRLFQEEFAEFAPNIPEVIIGMQASGELAYPSYHFHDREHGYAPAHVPHRGSLQWCSPLSQQSFREYLLRFFGSEHEARRRLRTESLLLPCTPGEVERFFSEFRHYSPFGQAAFDWYQGSLLQHAHRMMATALGVFHREDSPFRNAKMAFKIPGIHWEFHSRRAMLAAGQISTLDYRERQRLIAAGLAPGESDDTRPWHQRRPTEWNVADGLGYRRLFEEVFVPLRRDHPRSARLITGIYTAAEMEDCWRSCHLDGNCACPSRVITGAASLTTGIGNLFAEYGVEGEIENANLHLLNSERNVITMRDHLLRADGAFRGATLLRVHDSVRSPFVRRHLFERFRAGTAAIPCKDKLSLPNPSGTTAPH